MADDKAQNDQPRPRGGDSTSGAKASADSSKPQIGDSRPAPKVGDSRPAPQGGGDSPNGQKRRDGAATNANDGADTPGGGGQPRRRRRRRGGRGRGRGGQGGQGQNGNQQQKSGGNRGERPVPVEAITSGEAVELDEKQLKRRRGRTRKGKAVGRYLMCVHVGSSATQIATLEGRKLVEHQVSRPADDVSQIHGNIYLGRVQNVLPGMEAAFVDIATPKNAVLYAGDVHYDADDLDSGGGKKKNKQQPRIEDVLKAKQSILCQVTKNPIAHKGARLTQEVSLPGRFVVLVPNSSTYGISKRLPDGERKRLRNILDKAKPKQHGVIVRTAAENVTAEEIKADVARLLAQWAEIEKLSTSTKAPALLYREPEAAVRIIREEFTKDFRGVIIDDRELYEEIKGYVEAITPALADRIEYYDAEAEGLPLFERQHIDEQLRKALDRKVWLPSGGSLIIEATEALTVIDVNTGKNVGKSSLEETVYRNNLEAAEEVANQLRLRDIGGIIVIDFVDMEVAKNRDEVIKTFRQALARDKTRTQVFDISELGLVEMTRKRIGEGLLESVTEHCPKCEGTGHIMIDGILD